MINKYVFLSIVVIAAMIKEGTEHQLHLVSNILHQRSNLARPSFTKVDRMAALVSYSYGDLEDIYHYATNVPIPLIAQDEVLVEVHYSSVNPADWKLGEGQLGALPNFIRRAPTKEVGFTPGFDISGVVVSVGVNCHRLKVGDKVYGMTSFRFQGGMAEYVAVTESFLAIMPQKASFKDAAAIPLVGLTGYQAILAADLKKDQTILILGGATATGIAAIQIAKSLGAHVIVTASSKSFPLMKSFHADQIVDYRVENFGDVLTPSSIDLVYVCAYDDEKDDFSKMSTLLKVKEAFSKYFSPHKIFFSTKPNGRIISIEGNPGALTHTGDYLKLFILGSLRVKGQRTQMLTTDNNQYTQLDKLSALYDQGLFILPIDKVFKLTQGKDALAYSKKGIAKGKILVEVKP